MIKKTHLTPVKLVILLFGGARPLARLLGKSSSTIVKWQDSVDGHIPSKNHVALLNLAKKRNIELTTSDLILGRTLEKEQIAKIRVDNNIDKRIVT